MPDITPRLGLSKPKPQENVDINVLNGNSDILDVKYSTILLFPTEEARDTAFLAKPFDQCYVGVSKELGTPYIRRNGQWITQGGGATGPAGPGVPAGGTTGDYLRKKSIVDRDTEWARMEPIQFSVTPPAEAVKHSLWIPIIGLLVAVGANGVANISKDSGSTWQSIDTGANVDLNDCVWDSRNGRVVAVGNSGTVVSSADGVTWTVHITGLTVNDHLNSVVATPNAVYAVGKNGNVVRSTNLATWAIIVLNSSGDLNSIAYSESLDVLVTTGVNGYIGKAKGSDGIWTTQTNVFLNTYVGTCAIWAEELKVFVCVGTLSTATAIFQRSADGEIWAEGIYNPATQSQRRYVSNVVYDSIDDCLIATGAVNISSTVERVWVSWDKGANWSVLNLWVSSSYQSNVEKNDVVYHVGQSSMSSRSNFSICIGNDVPFAVNSVPDTVLMETKKLPKGTELAGKSYRTLAAKPDGSLILAFSAATGFNLAYTEDKGGTWTELTGLFTEYVTSCIWSSTYNRFFAISSTKLMQSTDGKVWSTLYTFGNVDALIQNKRGDIIVIGNNAVTSGTRQYYANWYRDSTWTTNKALFSYNMSGTTGGYFDTFFYQEGGPKEGLVACTRSYTSSGSTYTYGGVLLSSPSATAVSYGPSATSDVRIAGIWIDEWSKGFYITGRGDFYVNTDANTWTGGTSLTNAYSSLTRVKRSDGSIRLIRFNNSNIDYTKDGINWINVESAKPGNNQCIPVYNKNENAIYFQINGRYDYCYRYNIELDTWDNLNNIVGAGYPIKKVSSSEGEQALVATAPNNVCATDSFTSNGKIVTSGNAAVNSSASTDKEYYGKLKAFNGTDWITVS